jgi:hypothetical protein
MLWFVSSMFLPAAASSMFSTAMTCAGYSWRSTVDEDAVVSGEVVRKLLVAKGEFNSSKVILQVWSTTPALLFPWLTTVMFFQSVIFGNGYKCGRIRFSTFWSI